MSSPSAEPQSADAPAAGGKLGKLLPVIAVVVGLAVGGGAGLFAVGPALAKGIAPAAGAHGKQAKKAHDEAGEEGGDDEASADEEGGDGEKKEAAKGEHGEGGAESSVYTIDNLVLNPAASGGTRFLLLTISFDMKDAAALEMMKSRDAELRDAVLVTLGGKTVEQLSDMTMRDSLKAELKTATGALLKKKTAVRRVYFPQFVIQ